MDVCAPFSGKQITILGLGLLGRGVGDAEFLASCGAKVTVSDMKTAEELAPSVERLKKFPDIVFHLGEQPIEDFTDTDLVIKAAGIPLDSPHIAAARAAGVRVAMSTALFAKAAVEIGTIMVGITGTRGKTTVTRMIYHALVRAGLPAHLGGNIRGVSTLAMLPSLKKGDIIVFELDSWQLQGFGDEHISPRVAVFTNLLSDHMNYYGGDMDRYFADKANIFRNQKMGDTLIAGTSIIERIRKTNPPVMPQTPAPLPADWQLLLEGEHNRENASFAAAALRALGVSEDDIKAGLESFEAVEGRLQLAREVGGVKIYNDNNATTPEATIVALKTLQGKRPLTLIVGGTDKDVALEDLARAINETVDSLVLFAGTGTERLKSLLQKTYRERDSLAGVLEEARK
ncbi:MAG: hypothetical protein JO019_01210, partial [Candidatus Kaiserbacteria bacterium]|nr:hypothetical protein [Candidatus Kaiserbacteria bacterium]